MSKCALKDIYGLAKLTILQSFIMHKKYTEKNFA